MTKWGIDVAYESIVYSSDYIKIIQKEDGFYIESYKNGLSVEEFNNIIGQNHEIKITSFMAIKNAIMFAPKPLTKFGEMKERISVEISSDELKAYIKLCVNQSELIGDAKVRLIKDIMQKLSDSGVVFGIKSEVLVNGLCNDKQILVAEGIPPENGEDSVVKMYEMKEAKPEVKEDGKVDHYELNLINKAKIGDWLGERKDPSPGIPGKSVKGSVIPAMPGKNYPLFYDRSSVREEYENGVTTLYALRNGAIHYDGDRISVSNYLEIVGDVDFKTGNIEFDGYLTVKGSVEDNFTVEATKDIEILGDYGIGSVKEVISKQGSIYIKGGIAGKNKAVIKSKRDIYTKFISDATIICEGSVHVGFYCINSNITAREVILESSKGQIIGGNIQAEIKVVSSIIGSPSEKRTLISVKGFDRNVLKEKLEKIINKIEALKNELAKIKQELSIYTNVSQLTSDQKARFVHVQQEFFKIRDELKYCEEERKITSNALRAKGEGEITILKKAYTGVTLEIKNVIKEIENSVINTTFYIQDGDIKQI